MAQKSTFHWLASSLSLEERQELLRKLLTHSKLTREPLYAEEDRAESIMNIETKFSNLPWYKRLWYLIFGIIKYKTPIKIFLENEITAMGKKIDKLYPGIYDYRADMLMPVFYSHFAKLKDAAHFFYSALDASVNRDRESFYSFLGSLEMPNVHRRLEKETSPQIIGSKISNYDEREFRQSLLRTIEDLLGLISKEQRGAMYLNVRTLFCLKELSAFPFDRILKLYGSKSSNKRYLIPVYDVRDQLITLNNILISLKTAPPMALLESLFVFLLQKRSKSMGFNVEKEINLLLLRAEDSLNIIKEFNNKVPLTQILRCSTRETALYPREISGGEDWFPVYRDHWKKHLETSFSEISREKKQELLISSFNDFLKGENIRYIANTKSKAYPDGIPVRGAFAISFLYTFCTTLLTESIGKILYLIFISAEFKRDEDRLAFGEAYNKISNLEEEIKNFEHRVSESGDFGRQYTQAISDTTSISIVKQRRILAITGKVQEDAARIIEQARSASVNMTSILTGILGEGSPGGKNGSIYNLSKLAARESHVVNDTKEAITKFRTMLTLLSEIETMELSG